MDKTRPRIPVLFLMLAVSIGFEKPATASTDTAGWIRQFGTPTADEAQGVQLDQVGNAFVVGWTSGSLPGQASSGTVDAFLRKFDPDGNVLWTDQFGSWESDFARAVAVDESGNPFVVGETQGSLPGHRSAGGRDVFIAKYDPDGNVVWRQQFGGGGGEGAAAVALNRDGEAYVVGLTGAALPGQTPVRGFDAFIRLYDRDGQERWTRQFGSSADDFARGVAVDPAGNAFVVGSTEGALPDQASAGGSDVFIREYDGVGNELWTRQFGSAADDYGVSVAVGPAGHPTVSGSTDGSLPGQSSAGGTEAFLRRFSSAGSAVWTHQFGTGSADEGWGVAVDAAGDTYVVGTTEPSSPLQTTPPKTHCFVRKYDAAGKERWANQFGSEDVDLAFSVSIDPAGHAYVAGSTKGNFAGQKSHGQRDAYLLKLGRTGQIVTD